MHVMKIFKRILGGLVALIVVFIGVVFISYMVWYRNFVKELESGSRIASTGHGQIEYAVLGEGIPYLSLHGTPGGYDQVLIGRQISPGLYEWQQTIAVSRPGYLRTPLESGATFEEQADLFASLLDELEIERAVIFAGSGGGYAGLQLAIRHPDRCIALILYAPALGYEPLPDDPDGDPGFVTDLTSWAISGPLLKFLAPGFISNFDSTDPVQVETARRLIRTAVPSKARSMGLENDVRQRAFPEINDWPVDQIRVPTMILHGNKDENSDYDKSVDLASRIPNAKLVTYEGGDHFVVITRADDVRREVQRFVKKVLERQISEF